MSGVGLLSEDINALNLPPATSLPSFSVPKLLSQTVSQPDRPKPDRQCFSLTLLSVFSPAEGPLALHQFSRSISRELGRKVFLISCCDSKIKTSLMTLCKNLKTQLKPSRLILNLVSFIFLVKMNKFFL